jgi:serine/threonine-protein kinase
MDDAALTRSTVIAGTPQYMSPEQAQGEAIDHRTDLFSLGSVLYAMCTGHPPFRAETLMGVLRRISDGLPRDVREVNSDVPEWLATIIATLHALRADDRFQSAAELAGMLEQCLAHLQQPTLARLPELPRKHVPRQPGQDRSRSRLATLIAGTIVVGVAIALWQIWPHVFQVPTETPTGSPQASPQATANEVGPSPAAIHGAFEWRDGLDLELLDIDRSLRDLEMNLERN